MAWIAEKQASMIIPPQQGCTVSVNCSTTAQIVDLCSFPTSTAVPQGQPDNKNPIGHYVRITAEGGDVYYAFGSNTALLLNCNANAYTTVNATTGKVTMNGSETDYLPAAAWKDYIVMPGLTPQASVATSALGTAPGNDSPCRYIAVVSKNGNPIAHIFQSST